MAIPSWLSKSPLMAELASEYAGLDKAFDTSGIESSFGNANAFMLNDARARSGAMAAAAQNRARRSGGQVAASFAAGQAMLPAYRQQAESLANLAQLKLQASGNRAQLGASIAGEMAGRRQTQQGMLADWQNAALNRAQQGQQFNAQLQQQGSQFDRNLSQQGSQFDRSLLQNSSQFGQTLAFNKQNQAHNNQLQALQLAMQMPQKSYSWTADNRGNLLSGAPQYHAAQQQNMRNSAIQNRLLNLL